jgi:hypothetical protein
VHIFLFEHGQAVDPPIYEESGVFPRAPGPADTASAARPTHPEEASRHGESCRAHVDERKLSESAPWGLWLTSPDPPRLTHPLVILQSRYIALPAAAFGSTEHPSILNILHSLSRTQSSSSFCLSSQHPFLARHTPHTIIMGLLTLIEDRPTPKQVYNWRVYAAASVASWASCMIGYDSAFIGTTLALPSFVKEFSLGKMPAAELALTKANIVSVYQAGAFFGALGAYVSSHYFGRKKSLLFWTTIFMIGAGMMLGATGERGLGLIIGGRVLAGLGVGGCSNMVPIYISELSPPAVRGRLVGIYEMGWQIGGLVGL